MYGLLMGGAGPAGGPAGRPTTSRPCMMDILGLLCEFWNAAAVRGHCDFRNAPGLRLASAAAASSNLSAGRCSLAQAELPM